MLQSISLVLLVSIALLHVEVATAEPAKSGGASPAWPAGAREKPGGGVDAAIRALEDAPPRREEDSRAARAIAQAELEDLLASASVDVRAGALVVLQRHREIGSLEGLAKLDWTEAPRSSPRLIDAAAIRMAELRPVYQRLSETDRTDLRLIGAAGLAGIGDVAKAATVCAAIMGRDVDAARLGCELAARVRLHEALANLRVRAGRSDGVTIAATAALARLTPDATERARWIKVLKRASLASPTARQNHAPVAIEALGSIDDSAAVTALAEIREKAPSETRRLLAACALAKQGQGTAAEQLLQCVQAPGPEGAIPAAQALGRLANRANCAKLRALLDDPRSSVRIAAGIAYAGSGGLEDGSRELVACLKRARGGDTFDARLELASAMAGPAVPGFDRERLSPTPAKPGSKRARARSAPEAERPG